ARPAVLLTCCLALSLPLHLGAQDGAPVKKMTVRAADGLNLVCDVGGKGETALVFLHGWGGDRQYWKHQMEAFAPEYRVIAVDQAGRGEAGKERKEWTLAGLAADVEAVVKELGLKRVILVGHSMGGPIGLAAAKRMPGVVIAVIGADTLHNVEHKMPEDQVKKFMDAFDKDFKGTMRGGLRMMLPEKTDAELVKSILSRAEAQDPKMALALMRDLVKADTKVLLKEAKVPVRCINAAPGLPLAIATAPDVNKKYADFDAVIMEGVGHYPMLERPGEFNDKLREVLKGLAK